LPFCHASGLRLKARVSLYRLRAWPMACRYLPRHGGKRVYWSALDFANAKVKMSSSDPHLALAGNHRTAQPIPHSFGSVSGRRDVGSLCQYRRYGLRSSVSKLILQRRSRTPRLVVKRASGYEGGASNRRVVQADHWNSLLAQHGHGVHVTPCASRQITHRLRWQIYHVLR
jgi:hypothetical protein